MRWVLGPPGLKVHPQTATATVTAHGVGRVKVTRALPADEADETTWRTYLMIRLDDLGREIDEAQQRADRDRAAVGGETTAASTSSSGG